MKPDSPAADDRDKTSPAYRLCCTKVERENSRAGSERMVSEIFLSRLLSTKGTLQPFVNTVVQVCVKKLNNTLNALMNHSITLNDLMNRCPSS